MARQRGGRLQTPPGGSAFRDCQMHAHVEQGRGVRAAGRPVIISLNTQQLPGQARAVAQKAAPGGREAAARRAAADAQRDLRDARREAGAAAAGAAAAQAALQVLPGALQSFGTNHRISDRLSSAPGRVPGALTCALAILLWLPPQWRLGGRLDACVAAIRPHLPHAHAPLALARTPLSRTCDSAGEHTASAERWRERHSGHPPARAPPPVLGPHQPAPRITHACSCQRARMTGSRPHRAPRRRPTRRASGARGSARRRRRCRARWTRWRAPRCRRAALPTLTPCITLASATPITDGLSAGIPMTRALLMMLRGLMFTGWMAYMPIVGCTSRRCRHPAWARRDMR